MLTSKEHTIILRALEPSDLAFLYEVENDSRYWYLGSVTIPFSKHVLQQYLDSAHLDIYTTRQLRLIICREDDPSGLGAIDLYDFDPVNRRAGVGIYVSEQIRNTGIGYAALNLLTAYCKNTLNLHQVYATIPENNVASLALFSKSGFNECGKKSEWLFNQGEIENAIEMQLIL